MTLEGDFIQCLMYDPGGELQCLMYVPISLSEHILSHFSRPQEEPPDFDPVRGIAIIKTTKFNNEGRSSRRATQDNASVQV